MGLFGNRKKSSSAIAKERIKLVLIYDRAGTSSNAEMLEMMRRDIFNVISKYIEIEEEEVDLDIKTAQNQDNGVTSELVAYIPIRKVKKMARNRY